MSSCRQHEEVASPCNTIHTKRARSFLETTFSVGGYYPEQEWLKSAKTVLLLEEPRVRKTTSSRIVDDWEYVLHKGDEIHWSALPVRADRTFSGSSMIPMSSEGSETVHHGKYRIQDDTILLIDDASGTDEVLRFEFDSLDELILRSGASRNYLRRRFDVPPGGRYRTADSVFQMSPPLGA